MKVLMIRYAKGVSGAEVYNINLIKGIQKISQDIELLYVTNDRIFRERLKECNINTYLFDPLIKEIGTKKDLILGILLFPLVLFRYLLLIRTIHKKNKIEIICLQSTTEKLFLTYFLHTLQYRVFWLEHGPLYATDRVFLIKQLHAYLSKYVDRIIAVSEDTKQDLSKYISIDKISSVSTGVDADFFKPVKRKHSRDVVVGYCGRLVKEKGIITFMHVAERILKEMENISFIIVGDGEYYDWVKIQCKKFGIGKNIELTGFETNVKQYLTQMDIFFFPTEHKEGMSIALLEAMSMGLLVIANDSGGNREIIIPGETGILYKNKTEKEVANLIINSIRDYKTYSEMRKRARRLVVKKYTLAHMAEQFYILCNK